MREYARVCASMREYALERARPYSSVLEHTRAYSSVLERTRAHNINVRGCGVVFSLSKALPVFLLVFGESCMVAYVQLC